MVSSKKLLFYNTELDREKANLFMTPDNESVIKSNVQKCWLNEKYFVYLMMQNTEQMKISKAQREKLWNPQMGFNFHRFYTKTFTIHPVQFYQMQLCLKCRALSQILIVSTFQTSALQEIPFLFFKGSASINQSRWTCHHLFHLMYGAWRVIAKSKLCRFWWNIIETAVDKICCNKGHETAYNCTKSLEDE